MATDTKICDMDTLAVEKGTDTRDTWTEERCLCIFANCGLAAMTRGKEDTLFPEAT